MADSHFVYIVQDGPYPLDRGRPRKWELRYWGPDGRAAVFATRKEARAFIKKIQETSHVKVRILKGWVEFPDES